MTTILEHWRRHRKFGNIKWYYLFGHSSGNLIEQVSLPTFTASDTGQNTAHATEEFGSLSFFHSGIYYCEGKYGGLYQDDITRWPNATHVPVANVADFGTARYHGASGSTPHKLWQAGGWNDVTTYDDAASMPFATETCSVFTSGMMAAATYANIIGSSPMKIFHHHGSSSNVVEAWPHATETYTDIGDSSSYDAAPIGMLSDCAWYYEYLAQSEDKWSFATETYVSYSNGGFSGSGGDGSCGNFATHASGSQGGSATTAIYSFSFATETWVDTTQDVTGVRYGQARGAG